MQASVYENNIVGSNLKVTSNPSLISAAGWDYLLLHISRRGGLSGVSKRGGLYIRRNPDFAGFSRFSNVPGRFEFLLNSFDETPSSFHTASTRSIHPRPPLPPISISFFPKVPLPKFGGPIVRQIASNGQYHIASISTSTVFPIYGTPLGLCASTYYVDISLSFVSMN